MNEEGQDRSDEEHEKPDNQTDAKKIRRDDEEERQKKSIEHGAFLNWIEALKRKIPIGLLFTVFFQFIYSI